MKDIPKDQPNPIVPTELKKKRRHPYHVNRKNPIYSSENSSSSENDLNKKLKETNGYSGY